MTRGPSRRTVPPTGVTGVTPQLGATMRLRNVRPRHRAALALGASLLAFGLLAAACGSDDSGSSAGTTATGGGAGTTAAGGAATTAAAAETPVQGGKLVYGIEADTGSPWEPSKALLAISGHTVIRSVYDSARARDDRRHRRAVSRRVDHAERGLHGLDHQGSLGRDLPRRHAVRRRGDRRQPRPPAEVLPHREDPQRRRAERRRLSADRRRPAIPMSARSR